MRKVIFIAFELSVAAIALIILRPIILTSDFTAGWVCGLAIAFAAAIFVD